VSTLSTCATRIGVELVVYRVGSVPPPATPVDDHDTDHTTVAVTVKAPSSGSPSGDGWPADVCVYTCAQSVLCHVAGADGT
jgi:hypothetical protein